MRTFKGLLLIPLLSGTVTSAFGCLWGYVAKPDQKLPADIFKLHVHIDSQPLEVELPLLGGSVKAASVQPPKDVHSQFAEIIRAVETSSQKDLSFAELNDYAVALVFEGRYRDAITQLLISESKYPARYMTASNLGTAYELSGETENALTWIKKGLERNPESHNGTEWLHVAILETKLKLKSDPHWLHRHSVIDGHESRSREDKERAFEYQLNERLNFIRENDPIMCDLFYQAARVTSDAKKKTYFARQVQRFGSIRDAQLSKL